MKQFLKIIVATLGVIALFQACQKMDPLPVYGNGTPIVLSSSTTTVTPVVGDSNNAVVSFSWTDPKYATDSSTYKFLLEIDTADGNFSKNAIKTVTGSQSTTLTGRELNAILLDYGFSIGAPYELDVRVTSSYGNNNERYFSNVVRISVTPFNDPSVLTSSESSVVVTLANATQPSLTFAWTPSFVGYTGNITYTIQYDSAGKNFVSPVDFPVGISVLDRVMTQEEINTSAINSGIVAGASGTVEYRIKAVTALGAVSYSNVVNVTVQSYISILRFFMPGSYQTSTGNGSDWNPPSAPQLIRDLRPGTAGDMYYIYIYLPANAEFKFTQDTSWAINYGGAGGALSTAGANLTVGAAGVYRITINRTTLQYDIREGRMGFVGEATASGWNPPNVFPANAMGYVSKNLFLGVHDFTTGGWKLIDSDSWNSGSNSVDETRSYGTPLPAGSTLEVNGGNFTMTAAGRNRVIWDGRNPDNVKYDMNSAAEMRVVGDGMDQPGVNDWDPPTSPQMTYSGNGVWTISLSLKANKEIKFLAGNAWGAFDYEDNSGQDPATGVPKKIQWEGGANFKTPAAAGTYTIRLDEHAQTVTIN